MTQLIYPSARVLTEESLREAVASMRRFSDHQFYLRYPWPRSDFWCADFPADALEAE